MDVSHTLVYHFLPIVQKTPKSNLDLHVAAYSHACFQSEISGGVTLCLVDPTW